MTKIDYIKQNYNIVELAHRFGCSPYGNGNTVNTKFNCLRTEKTSSLKLYRETNTFHDFGSKLSGDVITFYSEYYQIDIGDTIESMLREIGKTGDDFEAREPKQIHIPDKQYMTPAAVLNAFNSKMQHIEVCPFTHHKDLETISPLYLIQESKENDNIEYFNLLRYSDVEKSIIALLPDEKGVARTFRYRYKKVGDDIKKWVALYGTQSSYLYCRFNENPITLIVEGTRDYLNAILCGYSVIALPSAGYKKLDNELLRDRFCVFIDDDDGKNSMQELYDSAICEKIFFNHKEFKKITKCESKDFSDYLYKFTSLKDFKDTFERFIYQSEKQDTNWKDEIFKISQPITKDDIANVENQEFLYDELLIKRNITTLVSPANTGKSALVFGMAKELLNNNKIENVLFFDPDSSIGYVKNTVNDLLDNYDGKFHYFNGVKNEKSKMMDMLLAMTLMKENKDKHTLIILDGLQFFINGEISKDSNVKPFMETLQQIRDKFGATIILLHHTKRAKDESGSVEYLGTQIIETATDNMIVATAKNDKIFLYVKKSRSDKKNNIYTVDVDFAKKEIKNVKLKGKKDEILEDSENDEEKEDISVESVLEFLQDKKVGLKAIKKKFGKEVGDFMKQHLDKYWKKETTKDVYSPNYYAIDRSLQITEFNNDDMEIPECLL